MFNFYVFFELSMTAAYILATYGGTRRELGAALVFTAVNLLGTFVFLLSVAGLYHVTGTLDMAQVAARIADVDPNAAILIAVGFFAAFSVKLGLFPFHFWLPTVYTGARPAVAAILSGGLANIGAYGLLRFGGELLPGELALAQHGADRDRLRLDRLRRRARGLAAHVDRDARLFRDRPGRAMCSSPIGVGGQVGFAAAILYSVVNALNKTLLFLTVEMRGALVGAVFALGALSVAGVPPAAGFVGKLELFRAAVGQPAPCWRSSSSAARCRSSTCSRSTSSTSGGASGPATLSAWPQQSLIAVLGVRRPGHGPLARAAAGAQPRRRRGAREGGRMTPRAHPGAGLHGHLPARDDQREAGRRGRRAAARPRAGRGAAAAAPRPTAGHAATRPRSSRSAGCWR